MKPIFQFGNVVVVNGELIGCIAKTWMNSPTKEPGYHYEVYIRSYNEIQEFDESEIMHFVYSKELAEEEKNFY